VLAGVIVCRFLSCETVPGPNLHRNYRRRH